VLEQILKLDIAAGPERHLAKNDKRDRQDAEKNGFDWIKHELSAANDSARLLHELL
jgi:hypothetical protein